VINPQVSGATVFRARGRSGTQQGRQRATGDREEAERRPRLGSPEEYKRSTRSPGECAWRQTAGLRPENLRFVEDGLGKMLRSCFLKGFYDDHVKRYKKHPIYWFITSPQGTLQALIDLHRYNRDTVDRFLNDYLRSCQQKLEAKRVSAEHVLTGGGSNQSEKTKAQKPIDEIRKALEELSTWERDVVRPLAEKRIDLDLDDGVKVNYRKLGV
jgi:type II restriction/modification system DNA methylase subunit YeeA